MRGAVLLTYHCSRRIWRSTKSFLTVLSTISDQGYVLGFGSIPFSCFISRTYNVPRAARGTLSSDFSKGHQTINSYAFCYPVSEREKVREERSDSFSSLTFFRFPFPSPITPATQASVFSTTQGKNLIRYFKVYKLQAISILIKVKTETFI